MKKIEKSLFPAGFAIEMTDYPRLVFLVILLGLGVFFSNCKKNNAKSPSDEKGISAFEIFPLNNPQISAMINARISGDSIYLPVPKWIPLTNLTPTISYTGASITPAATEAENFSSPVTYTVTAADGTSISYVVVAQVLSDDKSINSFVFEAANNPGLSADFKGIIEGDTIIVYGDSTMTLGGLIPSISYTGVTISPDSNGKEDFSIPVAYTVTAADGTRKSYTVFVSLDKSLYVGSDDGNVYALDASSGNLIWKYTTGGAIRTCPTLWNGMVYFLGGDSYAYALSATDGSLKWRYANNSSSGSNPTVQSGILYYNIPYYFMALDANTGNVDWQDTIDPWSSTNCSPTVANGTAYDATVSSGGPVVAFNASTGSRIFNCPGGVGAGSPAVVNGIVYSSNEGAILQAWDAQTGATKWDLERTIATSAGDSIPEGPGFSPTVYEGKVYVSASGVLFALDPNSGSILWQVSTNAGSTSAPVAGDGLIFSASSNGYLTAYDAGTGAQEWSNWALTSNGNYKYSSAIQPTFSNGTLYFGSADGYINAVKASTGQSKWSFPTAGQVLSGPCILDVNGIVHHPVGSGDQQ